MPQDYRKDDFTNDQYFTKVINPPQRYFYYSVRIDSKCVTYLKDYFLDAGNFKGSCYITPEGTRAINISGYSSSLDIAWLAHVIETCFPTLKMTVLEDGEELFTNDL